MGVLFWYFFGICLVLFCVFVGFRSPGGKKARQEATARKDRKEGRKEEGREGRKEGRREGGREGGQEGRKKEGRDLIFVHICAGNWQQRYFLLNPEPKTLRPYSPEPPNALRTVRPYDPKALKP